MLHVGLTGGIGCGKSTAAERFAALGAAVFDADRIAHELTRPGGPALGKIRDRFGDCVFTADGALDRAFLRRKIFSEPAAKAVLEDILHPMIEHNIRAQIRDVEAPYVVIVVPLLLERRTYLDIVDRVLVVDCHESDQIARAMRRSRLTESEVREIMAHQVDRATRLKEADDVLSNTGDEALLHRAVERQHGFYLTLAAAHEH